MGSVQSRMAVQCIYAEWRHISVIKNKYYTECNN